jgi:hypothetical protein
MGRGPALTSPSTCQAGEGGGAWSCRAFDLATVAGEKRACSQVGGGGGGGARGSSFTGGQRSRPTEDRV